MKKYIEIDWLQNVNTIQRNELFPYISNISENAYFIKNLKLQNNRISVSIIKNCISY